MGSFRIGIEFDVVMALELVRLPDDLEDASFDSSGKGHHKLISKLEHLDLVPQFIRHNHPAMHHGFRIGYTNVKAAVASIFEIHNDTLPIWTHLVPLPVFIWMSFVRLGRMTDAWDQFLFSVFGVSVVLCLAFSTAYHTVRCVSPFHDGLFLKLDISGIFNTIACSYFAPLRFAFTCSPKACLAYSLGIAFLSLACLFLIVTKLRPNVKVSRWVLVPPPTLLVAFSIAPIAHFHISHFGDPVIAKFYKNECGSIACYLLGLVLYMTNWPERWLPPGRHDMWIHSHVWWHLLVVGGIAWHFRVIDLLYDWKEAVTCIDRS
eukprot:c19477_g1_i2.p1 GENE.c19477_g1_i2~~c19477_g1_i2.p1  ORF type:complete len:319 (+),score=47.88 c19477_g1_i2:2-958(+)